MSETDIAAAGLVLAALDLAGLLFLARLGALQGRAQAEALEDVRHEVETGIAFLHRRLATRRDPLRKLPPIDDETSRDEGA